MKKMLSPVCMLIALLLCFSMAVPVYAASIYGIYISLYGSYSVPELNTCLETITTVKVNPDRAFLVTTVEFSNGLYSMGESSEQSGRSATSFSYDFPIPLVGGLPNYVYTCHEVRGGTSSPEAFAYHREGPVDFS